MIDEILTLEEAANRLRISKHTLYSWLRNGHEIRKYAFKVGARKWVFRRADLEKFIQEQRRKSLEEANLSQIKSEEDQKKTKT